MARSGHLLGIAARPGPLLALLALVGMSGCSSPGPCHEPALGERQHSIYVVRRAQHTGIVVRREDWPDREWALLAEFPEAHYLEFGWGDEVYYQAEDKTIRMTLAALLWPTPSVMQVIGFVTDPGAASDAFVEVAVSDAGLREMARSIRRSFAGETLEPTGPLEVIPQGSLRFYHARGSFYFPKMCNRWSAEQLAAAGCPLRPWTVVLAGRVVREARGFEAAAERRVAGR